MTIFAIYYFFSIRKISRGEKEEKASK